MNGKMIRTNKGIFKVRYVTTRWNDRHGYIDIMVVNDPENKMELPLPFTGKFGDEIPMLSTYREQYEVVVL